MTWQQIFVLATTFIAGFATGGYVFITGYAPNYTFSDFRDEFASSNELAIRAEQFGGCERVGVCPSFELDGDRRYRYIPGHSLSEETPSVVEGRLDSVTYNSLAVLVEGTILTALQNEGEVCMSASDGTDYRYDVVIDQVSYELNSCGTTFYGSEIYNELLFLWDTIASEEVISVETET